jgi:hypothetical protein
MHLRSPLAPAHIATLALCLGCASAPKEPPCGGVLGPPPPDAAAATTLPLGYWPEAKVQPILERTLTVRLDPDLSGLTPGERQALAKLLDVGRILHGIFEASRHPQAPAALRELTALDARLGYPPATRQLLTLYHLSRGPIAATLDNQREPFLPVEPGTPGKGVYPWAIRREEVEAFLAAHPEARPEILGARTVVRRADAESLERDLRALERHPALDTLHPGLLGRLARLAARPDPRALYAVPYAVAYADDTVRAHALLMEAAAAVERDDPDLGAYLRHRARDLLANDYEAGDASWVTGRFRRLNAQIGAYETYDDELYGVKAFYGLSALLRDERASAEVERAAQDLQAFEDALPYEHHGRVQPALPVGVYDVIADFGQARSANRASILPNDPRHAARYGRTVLLRRNVLEHPAIHEHATGPRLAALDPAFAGDLRPEGGFHYTLWHEIGHYLGVKRDRQGRDLRAALEEHASLLEEMKADLASLFVARLLRERGAYDDARLSAVYAAGIVRTLQDVQPRRDQPYGTMQLMQLNYFLEKGLLSFDRARGVLAVRHDRYHDVVASLLREVLAVQHAGDKAAAGRFIERYARWDKDLHEVLAERIRSAQRYRFYLMRYAALGE